MGFVINPVFGAYPAAGSCIFSFWWENIPFMMRFSLSLSLFCLMGYLSKVHERLLHKPPVFIICLAFSARILTQYVGCFWSGYSLGTLVHRPGSFLLYRKFSVLFPSFLGSLHFKWPSLTQGFIEEGSLSRAQLVLLT